MTTRLRFHLDENVHAAIGDALRRRGIDATTTAEAGLLEAVDEDHVAFALREQRVIVTRDVDFLRIAASGTEHCGIAYCHPERRTVGQIVTGLLRIWNSRSPDEMRNRIEFL